mmetsp:Transcript_2881/g.4227  ORF Transcript_2881/g.4227 Transcript_2881/m.4227 type:complete len:83 (+) Transcript_2881:228-476(+)
MDASTHRIGLLSTVTSLLLESFAGIVNYTFESSDFGPDTPFCGGQSATSKAGYRTLSTCHCTCYAGLCRADTSPLLDGSQFL